MLAVYDLLRAPWIPVEAVDGELNSVGIRDLLFSAQSLKRVADPSPLITYGIQRMLIALLMDVYRPRLVDNLADIMSTGKFDQQRLERYFALCQAEGNCFDLFDKEKPFFQSAFDSRWDNDKRIKPVSLLIHELPGGNNHVHFDHRTELELALSPSICARALCALNVFCTAGLQGPSSINGAPPLYVLHKGRTLFETLAGSMMATREYEGIPFDDPPVAWRGYHQVEPDKLVPVTSVLYGLTWQARRVLLIPDESGGTCAQSGERCPVIVRQIYFQKGLKFAGYGTWRDPHVGYLETKDGLTSLKPQEGRAPWRDIGTLMLQPGSKVSHKEPIIVHHYRDVREGLDQIESAAVLQVFGLATNQAQYESWMQGELELDQRIMQSEDLSRFIEDALLLTEDAAKDVRRHLQLAIVGKGQREIAEQAVAHFFSLARNAFFGTLCPATVTTNTMGPNWNTPLYDEWKATLRDISVKAFMAGLQRLGNSARHLERGAQAEQAFRRGLNKTLGARRID